MNPQYVIKLLFLSLFIIFSIFLPLNSLVTSDLNNFDPNVIIEDSLDDSEKSDSLDQFIVPDQKLDSRTNPKFGEKVWQFCQDCKNNEVSTIKFAPNMKLIAGGTVNGEIFVWDVTTGEKIYILKGSQNKLNNLLWTPDSLIIVAVYNDSIINFWNVTNGNLNFQVNLNSKIGDILNLDISHNGQLLAITSTDRTCSLWSIDISSKEINFIEFLIKDTTFFSIDIQFSPNDDQIALFLSNAKIFLWKKGISKFDIAFNHTVGILNKATDGGPQYYKGNAIDFSPDGKKLYISLLNSGNIIILDTASGENISPLKPKRISNLEIYISSVSIAIENTIIAYPLAITVPMGYEIFDFGFEIFDSVKNKTILERTDGVTTTVELSRDGSMLATIGIDQTVTIWNMIPNSEIRSLVGHLGMVWQTDFLNESILVSSSYDSVRIWNDQFLLKTIDGDKLNNTHPSGVTITETLKKDILIAFGTKEGKVMLYNYTDDSRFELIGHKGEISELDFSPDGSLLASAGESSLKIWNTSTRSLFNDIRNYPGDDVIWNRGVEFLSNTEVVVSGSWYGGLFTININGTIILSKFLPQTMQVLALDVSEDKTLVTAFTSTGHLILLNLTSGELLRMEKLPIFEDIVTNTVFFADVDFTPDNRYIIACSGFRHTLYFIDTYNFTVKHSIFLNIQNSFRTKLEPTSWFLSVSKDDYSVSIYNMSPLKTNNFSVFDFDGDGMSDFWEQDNNLSNNWYWDRFDDPDQDELVNWEEYNYSTNPQSSDTDGDLITDTYEVKYNLNPLKDDSHLDKDGDGMDNLFEFNMGLDSSFNDSSLDPDLDGLTNLQEFIYKTDIHKSDSDADGMPDKWEVDNHLNPIDARDSVKDNDLDGITNLNEFKAGSDPNSFFSVPLLSINNLYVSIVLSGLVLFLLVYFDNRRRLTNKFLAPDYSSALKVKKSGFNSWYDFTQKEKEVERQLAKAKSLFLEGLVDQSLTLYYSLTDTLKLLGKEIETSETLIRIIFINQILQKSSPIDYKLINEKFPFNKRNTLILNYKNILKAFEYESTNNSGLALELLNKVYLTNLLPPEFTLITYYSIIDLLIEQMQINKSEKLLKDIEGKINSMRSKAEKLGLYEFVCGSYLLQARLYFYKYKLDDAIDFLDTVTDIATSKHIFYFIQKASMEVQSFIKIKDTIKKRLSLTDESILTLERNFEEFKSQMIDYATKAKQIIEREEE